MRVMLYPVQYVIVAASGLDLAGHHWYSMFPDLSRPQAIIVATDIAMRQHLPPDILSLTVTVPMLTRFLSLDDGHSFLDKPFLTHLNAARAGTYRHTLGFTA